MEGNEYLQDVLSVLARLNFSFDAVTASAFPLVPLADRLLVAPDLLTSKPIPVLELPVLTDVAIHEMVQVQHQDHVFVLRHRETGHVVSEFCFKLVYCDDVANIRELIKFSGEFEDNEEKYHKNYLFTAHSFVLDALAMYTTEYQDPKHTIPIIGTYLVRWHEGTDRENHLRLAGLTIMQSVQTFIPLHQYLHKSLELRSNPQKLEDEHLRAIRKPIGVFLKQLLTPVFEMLVDFETNHIRLFDVGPKTIWVHPDSGKVAIKEFYDCEFIVPENLVCSKWESQIGFEGLFSSIGSLMFSSSSSPAGSSTTNNTLPNGQIFWKNFLLEYAADYQQFLDNQDKQDCQHYLSLDWSVHRPHHQSVHSFLGRRDFFCFDDDDMRIAETLYDDQQKTYTGRFNDLTSMEWGLLDHFERLGPTNRPSDVLYLYEDTTRWLNVLQIPIVREQQDQLGFIILAQFVLNNIEAVDFSSTTVPFKEYLASLKRLSEAEMDTDPDADHPPAESSTKTDCKCFLSCPVCRMMNDTQTWNKPSIARQRCCCTVAS